VVAGATLLAATWAGVSPRLAHADDKQQCLEASDAAQQLRDDGKYRMAREAFATCSRDVCPGLVRRDCVKWMAELEQSWPSIVFNAKDGRGGDLVDVVVQIDGTLLVSKLDGTPTPVDPGPHVLRFEAEGVPAVEQRIVVHAGEKSRLLTVHLGAPTGPPGADSAAVPNDVASTSHGPSASVWIFGGLALVAFGTEAYFGLSGLSDRSDLEGQPCARTASCSQSSVDSIRTKFTVADVALGAGVVSAGVAVYFLLTGTSAAPPPPAAVDVAPLPGGAGMKWSGRF
jgi:hypothetical protein